MSEKRRDSKNRILRTGESQEADGRYKYRYIDANGKRKSVYSWRLVATDSVPYGKKDNAPLRDQEKLINRDLDDMIVPDGGGLTVSQLVSKYIATKTGVKHTTRAGYGTVMNLLEKDPFGDRRIDKVRLSDAKEWLIKLQQVDKKSYSAIHSIRGVVRPAFQLAVDDDILRKNPFEFQLATVLVNDAVTRETITKKQEKTFLEFIKNDAHYCKYYDGMYILFKTGMRISEFTGLTLKDLDMENRTINIDHQLQKTGTLVYIDTTKTYAGTRVIPMQDDVYECFQNIIKARPKLKVEPMIDGYSGFLCFDKMVSRWWPCTGRNIFSMQCKSIIAFIAFSFQRSHHTYAVILIVVIWQSWYESKVLQYLMGHSDISVTLNTYTHLKLDDAKEEMEKLAKAQEATMAVERAEGKSDLHSLRGRKRA